LRAPRAFTSSRVAAPAALAPIANMPAASRMRLSVRDIFVLRSQAFSKKELPAPSAGDAFIGGVVWMYHNLSQWSGQYRLT